MSDQGEPTYHRQYSTVLGYFLQDDEDTDPWTFDYTSNDFGLKPLPTSPSTDETPWQIFEKRVHHLNQNSDPNIQYKVLFMGRHGQGVHNVAEKLYGTPMWNCKYSLHDGDATMQWADAHLTPLGIQQAQTAHAFWAAQLAREKMPAPQSYYASPLDRCLATANITFAGLALPADRPYEPTLLRETHGLHTCDRRSSRSYIRTRYPNFRIEASLSEEDELWTAELRESDSALDVRLQRLLDDVFENDGATWISFTSHSGAIAGLLRVLGHRPFVLLTGSVIPVLVRAKRVQGARPWVDVEPGWGAPECEEG
ncbi:hypothetical protein MMC13_000027 [Lambiella insularis]|nr:hypothetical protein [Lambiella insularis]